MTSEKNKNSINSSSSFDKSNEKISDNFSLYNNNIKEQRKKHKKIFTNKSLLTKKVLNPIWLSISESSKIGGVGKKTIRRAIQSNNVKYKIVQNRYFIDLNSLIIYLHSKTKLKNKLNQNGIGQYVDSWLD